MTATVVPNTNESTPGEVFDDAGAGRSAWVEGLFEALRIVGDDELEIVREIATGGMGKIVEALDRRHDRRVAVKMLHKRGVGSAHRFLREIYLTARLQHPSITCLYEAGRWSSGVPFFTMRFVEGGSLADAASAATTLDSRLSLMAHAVASASAIAHAHERGVIHRDLKPANVLTGSFGETVVIDWGLAKALGSPPEAKASAELVEASGPLTRPGKAFGTPCYMAPEQARGEIVGASADVYALGAILYHLFTGRPPHDGPTPKSTVEAVLTGPPQPLAECAPETPRELVSVIERAMERDPLARYASARELCDALRALSVELAGRVTPARPRLVG